MRTLVILLGMCGVAHADIDDVMGRVEAREKLSKYGTSMGKIPVKYHEQFGPYKLWVMIDRNGFSNFEARFVTLKNGNYIFGIDDTTTSVTKTKQTRIFAVPMKRFNLQAQEEFRKEFQKRQKDLKEKRVTYPEPPPSTKEVAKKEASGPVGREPMKRGSHEPPTKAAEQKPATIPLHVKVK